jgi:hypothetical protein
MVGDGLNDAFGIPEGTVSFYSLEVFDRYGQQIISLENAAWDGGEYSGGSYIYLLQYKIAPAAEMRTLKGVVNLIR